MNLRMRSGAPGGHAGSEGRRPAGEPLSAIMASNLPRGKIRPTLAGPDSLAPVDCQPADNQRISRLIFSSGRGDRQYARLRVHRDRATGTCRPSVTGSRSWTDHSLAGLR